MTDGYTDEWGYEKTLTNLKDWKGFEPWDHWSKQFDWTKEKIIKEQDIIAFRETTRFELWKGDTFIKDLINSPLSQSENLAGNTSVHDFRIVEEAKRFVIARIANMIENNIYLEVLTSECIDAFSSMDKVVRDKTQLFRYGIYRWPRDYGTSANPSPKSDKCKGVEARQQRSLINTTTVATGGNCQQRNQSFVFNTVARYISRENRDYTTIFNATLQKGCTKTGISYLRPENSPLK